jgi:hypothetical protein
MGLHALNDHCIVEIEKNKYGKFVSNEPPKGFECGTLVSISEKMSFFGGNSFVFENSLLDDTTLSAIQTYYAPLVGKKVYWPEFSDRGVIIEKDDKSYCLMKLSLLTAYEDGEE